MATKNQNSVEIVELLRRMWLGPSRKKFHSTPNGRSSAAPFGHRPRSRRRAELAARRDYVYGGHRSHGHAIGADINKLMAEIAGRATGYCGGKGGSMHIVARECGFITATGVVGGTIPLALGAAFAAKERKKGQIAVVFFGDGAGQSGPFHESLNIASLWQLPVIFFENNGYAEFTPLSAHTKIERLAQHAKTYGIPADTVDGNDLFAVRGAMTQAVDKCRAGKGPIFVECLTHRMRGHYEGDPAKYRELSQLAEWKKKDPILRVARTLKSQKALTDKELAAMENEAQALAEKAAEFSLSSPWPANDQVASQVTSD
jgi:pyruvate dehydrogenase E1 component alpha subunit